MNKAIFNWSGGKDSSLSLYYLLQTEEYDIQYLVTSVNSEFNRVSMHGVRMELLRQQVQSIGIPLFPLMMPQMPTMEMYDELMENALKRFRQEGIDYSIFGDIFLEDLKKYREDRLARVGMNGVFPIWKKPSQQLVQEFIDLGFKAVLVCVDEKHLDQSFAGRLIDESLLKDLPKGVDPCGENGEYHSFVYDGPIFQQPIEFNKGDIVYKTYADPSGQKSKTGFWYCDLVPVN